MSETRKFYPVGVDAPFLRIGFQLNFDLPLSPELSDWVNGLEALGTNLVKIGSNEERPVVHVALPAHTYTPGNIFGAQETRIIFSGARRALAQPNHWLMLQRKNPNHFMVCGRNGPKEKFPFGFYMHKLVVAKKGRWATETLQPLAYPGIEGTFNPVFVKMQLGRDYRVVLVEAEDVSGGDVVVSVREVGSALLPAHMRKIINAEDY